MNDSSHTLTTTMRLFATSLALIFLGWPLPLSAQNPRTLHALVIGCDYAGTKFQLPSPLRDADRIAKALEAAPIGFEVTLLKNPDRRAFLDAVDTFGETLARKQGVGLFYFSGHGMQHEGENYLMPVGAMPGYREDLPTECVAASRVMVRMNAAGNGTNLLFLDACRDSPLPSATNKSVILPGLVQMSGSGMLIGFAADSGKVALDSGQGSRYTNALLKHLSTPGISVAELLTRVRRDVIAETGRKQEPFVYMGLDELFAFVPGEVATVMPDLPMKLADRLRSATRDRPYVNSLGMEFIPVPGKEGVWMCRTETRVRDFRAYVEATAYVQTGGATVLQVGELSGRGTKNWDHDENASWENPGFDQGEDHPVVCVSWEEARAFCEWLSKQEAGLIYRLPSDAEWSAAVGSLGGYPWGNTWPPPQGAGNYFGKEGPKGWSGGDWETAYDHEDGYERTAPVGSFPENRFGFFDLSGNVWEWCEDEYKTSMNDAETLRAERWLLEFEWNNEPFRALRGGSWDASNEIYMRSSYRNNQPHDDRDDAHGFRVVVGSGI